jgi:hypothetical protein
VPRLSVRGTAIGRNPRYSRGSLRRVVLICAAACAALSCLAASAAGAPGLVPAAGAFADGDPLAYSPERAAELERAAAAGLAHVLYERTPDGVVEAARRTARYRRLVERATSGSGFSADVVEAMIFLESAGWATARASDDPRAAAGLTQIMAGTARDFLGMRVNLYASKLLTRRIVRARARGQWRVAARLQRRRAQVDERYAPAKALAATVRYLTRAREYLARNDLAVVSYHMGIGNLQDALRAYGEGSVPYVQLYFDSAPDRHAAAWNRLSQLADESRDYYWKVLAAKQIMHLYRTDGAQLETLVRLHAAKLSHEEVLHPPARTPTFERPRRVVAARRAGALLAVPDAPARLGVGVAWEAGEMAQRLGRSRTIYRALRPEALALLLYMGRRVEQLSGSKTPLVVTSAVRDEIYQRVLTRRNSMAARSYSLHTTGYAFDIAREWESPRHADAVQFVLDRLEAQGLIAYIKEPTAIHIAVSKRARILVPAMLRAPDEPEPIAAPEPTPAPVGAIGEAAVAELPQPPVARPAEPRSWLEELRERLPF